MEINLQNQNNSTQDDITKYKWFYIFEWASENQIRWIIKTSAHASFPAWYTVMNEWDEPNWKAYLILEWFVKILKWWNEVAILNKWDIFWEIALICDEPRTATVIAWANLECIILSKENLLDLSNVNSIINEVIISRYAL